MQRMIDRPLTAGDMVDHINRIKHDCRRENLRLTDRRGNAQNKGDYPGRGTRFNKISGKWIATAYLDCKEHYAGSFLTREEAAIAAKNKRIELNFLGSSH